MFNHSPIARAAKRFLPRPVKRAVRDRALRDGALAVVTILAGE